MRTFVPQRSLFGVYDQTNGTNWKLEFGANVTQANPDIPGRQNQKKAITMARLWFQVHANSTIVVFSINNKVNSPLIGYK